MRPAEGKEEGRAAEEGLLIARLWPAQSVMMDDDALVDDIQARSGTSFDTDLLPRDSFRHRDLAEAAAHHSFWPGMNMERSDQRAGGVPESLKEPRENGEASKKLRVRKLQETSADVFRIDELEHLKH